MNSLTISILLITSSISKMKEAEYIISYLRMVLHMTTVQLCIRECWSYC